MITITTLIENTNTHNAQLCCEHGLSLHISCNNKRYILDTGASGDFIDNASTLGIPLTDLDAVIISHCHYDHIGGLERLLQLNNSVKVYIKREADGEFFHQKGENLRSIGGNRALFTQYSDRIIFIDQEFSLSPDVHLLSSTISEPRYRCKDMGLMTKCGGALVPDSFKHELYMVIQQRDGITILSSCSHCGIVNIIRSAQERFPDVPIKCIIGGFHMAGADRQNSINSTQEYIEEVAAILGESCAGTIHTGHCTGHMAYSIMQRTLGTQINLLTTGAEIIL